MLRLLEHSDIMPPPKLLPSEQDFYQSYTWCLHPYLTVREAFKQLHDEIDKLQAVTKGWQVAEIGINIFLLCGALLNAVDEYLRGPTLRMPRELASRRPGRYARRAADKLQSVLRCRHCQQVRHWKDGWEPNLCDFLSIFIAGDCDPATAAKSARRLLLKCPLPPRLLAAQIGVPTPFRRLDLTHHDVLALGRKFVGRFPDRSQAILIVGLRTSGSYFAPLLKVFLKADGYATVSALTVQPNKGPDAKEAEELKRFARRGYTVLILDDAPYSAKTILLGSDLCRRAGFDIRKIKIVAPTHPAKRSWSASLLHEDAVVTLEPEEWHKYQLLEPARVERRLEEYFKEQGFTRIRLVASRRVEDFNARLQSVPCDERAVRIKRIFEVHISTPQGRHETRYILAKSVGWGWLGYHAFLAGARLSGFVPDVLGLRDGLLYQEWLPQHGSAPKAADARDERISAHASYVAARTCSLRVEANSVGQKGLQRHQYGLRLLEKVLSRAHGRVVTDTLTRPRIQRRLCDLPCPVPTLIDGRMRRAEWIAGPTGLLKTDYEHHGIGKSELNVLDPAYDLAETILDLTLSPEEEKALLDRYVKESGDVGIEQRLFTYKLLAGLWAMDEVQNQIFCRSKPADRQELHERFLNAWNFLTIHAARYCGSFCRHPKQLRWTSPLVALDVDGVIDRRVFGFPCTTAAGIEALSLFNAHGFSVALNTARSAPEVKEYCHIYSFAGGVAEYGGYLWDAIAQRERILVSAEARQQLDELRTRLQRIPGVFLDSRHQYSIRAFTYREKPKGLMSSLVTSMRSSSVGDGALAPLPTLVIQQLITDLELDRLCFHQTMIDTTIVPKEVDKGRGLLALRDWVLGCDAETIAVGDSEPDLPMFRVATRSFAPANIGCGQEARILGCKISCHPHQRGLLNVARQIIHPDGIRCESCTERAAPPDPEALFFELLRAADRTWTANLIRALVDPASFRVLS